MNAKKPDLSVIVSRKPTAAEQATFDLIWKMPKGLTKDLFKKKGVDSRAADQLVKDGALVAIEGVYSVPVKLREVEEETPEEKAKLDAADDLKARAASPKAVEVEERLMRLLADAADGTTVTVGAEDQEALGLEVIDGEEASKTLERHRALFVKVEDPKEKAKAEKTAIKAAKDEFDAAVTALTEGKATAEDVKAAKAKYDAAVKEQASKNLAAKPAKAKAETKMGPCLDGCGAQVKRPTNFVPGHDAKFKSILLKIVTRDEAVAKRDALVAEGKTEEAGKVKVPDAPELPRLTGEDGEHQKAYVLGAAWATPAMKSLFL